MTTRRTLSPLKRLAVFENAGGRCYLCGLKIQVGQRWEVEHVRALGLLGADDESNYKPAHVDCHKVKTKDDVARIAKAKRQKARHIGIRHSSNPMPGSRASKWKCKIGGRTELR